MLALIQHLAHAACETCCIDGLMSMNLHATMDHNMHAIADNVPGACILTRRTCFTVSMKLADVVLRLPGWAVLYHARAQAVVLHEAVGEPHTVWTHGVATAIAVITQFLIIQVCNSLVLDRHVACQPPSANRSDAGRQIHASGGQVKSARLLPPRLAHRGNSVVTGVWQATTPVSAA